MNRKKLLIILIVGVAIGFFFWLDLSRFLTLQELKAWHQTLLEYRRTHPLAMVAGFMAIYIIQTTLSLPGATILSLAAGAIFGAIAGTVYAIGAAGIGATLAFLATRYLLADVVQNKFGHKLERINSELEARGLNYLLFLRLVPLFPFFLINLAAGLTRLPLSTFVLGTVLGIIPGGFVFVNAGASLATVTATSDIASPRVLGSLALLGLFALLPALYTKIKGRTT